MQELVVVDRLVKRYGPRFAVRDVSFAVEEGEVIGLLGPNGSGKSTILRVLAGYLPPSAGNVRIAGIDVVADSLAVRGRVGYVPEDAPLYDGLRVVEFLRFMAAIKGMGGRAARSAVEMAAERLELGRTRLATRSISVSTCEATSTVRRPARERIKARTAIT
jgi:ABC-2 type transport system ATP-binding protein